MKTTNQKQWWAPLWKGLIMDEQAKHYQKMGKAIWIFLYLILNANRQTGLLMKKVKTIASDTGIKIRTVRKWLTTLKEHGYIQTCSTGRCLCIEIKKWKRLSEWHNCVTQNDTSMPIRVTQPCHSDEPLNSPDSAHLSQKLGDMAKANDITLKKNILNKNVRMKLNPFEKNNLKTKEERLAFKICKIFKDERNLSLYRSYAKKYPEKIILKAFNQVNEMPLDKIKKSKGALFTYLVKHYAHDKATS